MNSHTTIQKEPVKIELEHDDIATEATGFEAVAHAAPVWLGSLRAAAKENYSALGMPTLRHEEWRSTDLAPLRKCAFVPAAAREAHVSPEQLQALRLSGIDGPVMVFVAGRFSLNLSRLTNLPAGLQVMSLDVAATTHAELLREHFERDGAGQSEAFSSLNAALTEGGAFVHIARGAQIAEPLTILSVSVPRPGEKSVPMTNPRNIIIAEAGCSATVIEQYVSLGEGVSFTNAVTDVTVAENANLEHYLIEQESSEAFNVSVLRSRQRKDSRFASHTVLFGGRLVRNNVHPILDGSPCECLINGLFVGAGSQHMDNHMRVEHAKPHGDSRQFYKGILAEKATGVFSGRIIVHEGAQKTDAKQSNQNLLLSKDASISTRPQLEIYADDVKCTHGATIGQLDDNALFYLRSRGLSETAARNMLIYAFAGESLDRMQCEAMREALGHMLYERLPHGELVEPIRG